MPPRPASPEEWIDLYQLLGIQETVFGGRKSSFIEVSLFQGCPYREIPLSIGMTSQSRTAGTIAEAVTCCMLCSVGF